MSRVETEWQFSSRSLDEVAEWLAHSSNPEILAVGETKTVRLRDTYLDTPDWKIYRAGYSLRIRRFGRIREATLKSLDGRMGAHTRRREITQPIAADTIETLFEARGPVSERLLGVCKRRELQPLAEVRTVRRETLLHLKRGTGTLCLDRSSSPASGTRAQMQRVELEVVQGRPEEFAAFLDRLQSECSLAPASGSKYSWALSVAGKSPPVKATFHPAIRQTSTIGALGAAALQAQVSLLLWNEPGTRFGDDPRHLHDMRVAARRVRAAFRLLRETGLPRESIDVVEESVRSLRSTLGAVRDLDVRMHGMRSLRSSLVSVPPDSLDPYLALLAGERESARENMIRYLDSPSYRNLVSSLQRRFVTRTRNGEDPLLYKAAPRLIRRSRRKVVRLGDSLSATSAASDFHRLRILCKRLRYTLEFTEPAYSETWRSMIEEVTRVQDLLGTLQDANVTIDSLRIVSDESQMNLPRPTLVALGEVAQIHRHRRDVILAQFPSVFGRLHGKRWKALRRELNERERELPEPGPSGFQAPRDSEPLVKLSDSRTVSDSGNPAARMPAKSRKG
jgi:triphosphatase